MNEAPALIEKFNDLYDFSHFYRKGTWIFRGHSNPDHELKPSVGRSQKTLKNESRIFDQFKRGMALYSENNSYTEWEQLAVGQHHGLPTRLLDWTENCFVAAYFACIHHYEKDGIIYALNINKLFNEKHSLDEFREYEQKVESNNEALSKIKQDSEKQKELIDGIHEVCRYRPRYVSNRIAAQRGLFTLHLNPGQDLRKNHEIKSVVISKDYKEKLRWDLSKSFHINSESLFPDLDGLARKIKWSMEFDNPYDAT
jgi:hypothetical protein